MTVPGGASVAVWAREPWGGGELRARTGWSSAEPPTGNGYRWCGSGGAVEEESSPSARGPAWASEATTPRRAESHMHVERGACPETAEQPALRPLTGILQLSGFTQHTHAAWPRALGGPQTARQGTGACRCTTRALMCSQRSAQSCGDAPHRRCCGAQRRVAGCWCGRHVPQCGASARAARWWAAARAARWWAAARAARSVASHPVSQCPSQPTTAAPLLSRPPWAPARGVGALQRVQEVSAAHAAAAAAATAQHGGPDLRLPLPPLRLAHVVHRPARGRH